MKSEVTLHRLHLVRDLCDISKSVGHEKSFDEVMPALQELNNDAEAAVRHALVEQTVELARYFKLAEAGETGYHHILHTLLPIVAGHTTDTNPQVRQSSTEALVEIGKLLEPEHISPHLLPIVKSLAKDGTEEEHRVEGAQLLNNLAPIMKRQLCIEFAIPHLRTLSKDPVFRVRKAVAQHMGNICQTVGVEETTDKLLPIFVALASDEIWGVRKACAESLFAMSENVSIEKRTQDLTHVFEVLSKDSSRWVCSAACQALGPFISTFVGHPLPASLLEAYCNMVPEPSPSSQSESSNITYCAYNFPAVLQTLGKDGWHSLSVTYDNLVKDPQYPVRRSLSFSLHEVARILGTKLSEEHLIGTLELFLRDLDEVKVGVVSHLSDFFEVLSEKVRQDNIHVLKDVLDDDKWRVRKLLAKQVGALALLYPPEMVSKEIVGIFMGLLNDEVFAVRKAVTKSFSSLSKALKSSPEGPAFTARVTAFATDKQYQRRQLFASLCAKAATLYDPVDYETDLLPGLLALVKDKVPNVRFVAARALRKLVTVEHFKVNPEVVAAHEALIVDDDQDVVFHASGRLPVRLHSYLPKSARQAAAASSSDASQAAPEAGAGAGPSSSNEIQPQP
jgi:serine/threonine-protein phosphatase 4 regulatory subunit 1